MVTSVLVMEVASSGKAAAMAAPMPAPLTGVNGLLRRVDFLLDYLNQGPFGSTRGTGVGSANAFRRN